MRDDKNVIEVKNVNLVIGKEHILHNIDISFEKGKIHGLIGRNGSGKTMLMKCICGFVKYTDGEIFVEGKKIGKEVDFPNNIGIIIETPGFIPYYSGKKNLEILAGLKKKIGKKEIEDTIRLVGLDPKLKKSVRKYSLGMRQRLGMAQAVMEDPDILILDEPMNGLDKQGVADMRELLLKLKNGGKTIILASHSAEDIEILCDTVCELDRGYMERIKF
ncbi:MAG: ATP-binding cassette domain-containing protein [Lachnospiraceae bacterium]|nr:ATP-binding cassette domain-containing protein [Lachnospiraceae bacterium]